MKTKKLKSMVEKFQVKPSVRWSDRPHLHNIMEGLNERPDKYRPSLSWEGGGQSLAQYRGEEIFQATLAAMNIISPVQRLQAGCLSNERQQNNLGFIPECGFFWLDCFTVAFFFFFRHLSVATFDRHYKNPNVQDEACETLLMCGNQTSAALCSDRPVRVIPALVLIKH